MPTMPEHYRILGVSPKAELAEIKRRFRRLALKFHPDRNPRNPEAAAKFRQVAEAYGAICDRRARRPVTPHTQPEQGSTVNGSHAFAWQDLKDFFGAESFSPGLPSFGGPDYRYDLQIPFLSAMWGLEKELEVERLAPCQDCRATGMQPGSYYQDCPSCQGRGRRRNNPGQLKIGPVCEDCQGHGKVMSQPCVACGGQGHRLELKKYRLAIPPGVEDGARICLAGEGGEGFQHGPPGRLVVVIHVEPHSFFTRHYNDLHGDLDVSFAQAVLGDSIEVPTLLGPRILELPRGTRSGQSFLFPGLGVPTNGNCHPGNLIITIHISTKARFAEDTVTGPLLQPRSEENR